MHTPLNSTPMMRSSFKKSAVLSLVALSTVSALVGGCKRPSEIADEKVAADVKDAADKLATAPDGSASLPILTKTLTTPDVSPAQKAVATMAAGDAELRAADAVFHKIDAAQNHMERLVGRVSVMTSAIRRNNITLAGLTVREPAKSLAMIDKSASAAKTGDQGVWFPSSSAPIPALASLDKSIADISAKGEALKTQRADMEKQRADMLAQAEKLTADSDKAKGKQSFDIYVQAANARKTAGNLATQLQDLDSQIAANARELAVVQAQQTQLQASLGKFDDATKQVNAGWESVKVHIDAVVAKTKQVIDGDPLTAPSPTKIPTETQVGSLTAAGDQIAQVSADLDKLRADAKAHLSKADRYFADAGKLNASVASEYNKLINDQRSARSGGGMAFMMAAEVPAKQAWSWMVEIHGDADPLLQRAHVAQRLARLYADEYVYGNSRFIALKAVQAALNPTEAPVKATYDQAKIELPKTLDPTALEPQVAAASTAANDAFKQAETDLDQATTKAGATDTGKSLKDSIDVTRMIEQYAHWAFAKVIADPQADTFKKKASELAASLTTAHSAALPSTLPPEIAPPPPADLTAVVTSTTSPAEVTPAASSNVFTPAPAVDTTPEQHAVRGVVTEFTNALVAGDAAKAKTFLVPNPQSDAMVDGSLAMTASLQKLGATAAGKFPNQAAVSSLVSMMQNVSRSGTVAQAKLPITVVADKAAVGSAPAPAFTLTLAGGAWKIDPDANATLVLDLLKKFTTASDAISADLDSGKIATAEQLSARLMAMSAPSAAAVAPDGTAPATQPSSTGPSTEPPASAPATGDTTPATAPAAPVVPPADGK